MDAKKIALIIGSVLLLGMIMGTCVCVGVPLAQAIVTGARDGFATVTAEAQRQSPSVPPATVSPLPQSPNVAPTPVQASVGQLKIKWSTQPQSPLKEQPFQFIVSVSTVAGEPFSLCAVNFRGDIAGILQYDGLVSPNGQDFWVSGSPSGYEQGAIFSPCIQIQPGSQQDIVFSMLSYTAATWDGLVGICSQMPTRNDPDAALDDCIYIPVSVTVR